VEKTKQTSLILSQLLLTPQNIFSIEHLCPFWCRFPNTAVYKPWLGPDAESNWEDVDPQTEMGLRLPGSPKLLTLVGMLRKKDLHNPAFLAQLELHACLGGPWVAGLQGNWAPYTSTAAHREAHGTQVALLWTQGWQIPKYSQHSCLEGKESAQWT